MKNFIFGMLLAFVSLATSATEVGLTSDFDQNDQVVITNDVDLDITVASVNTDINLDITVENHVDLFDNLVYSGHHPTSIPIPSNTYERSNDLLYISNATNYNLNYIQNHNKKAIIIVKDIPIDKGYFYTYENKALHNKILRDAKLMHNAYKKRLFKSTLFEVLLA